MIAWLLCYLSDWLVDTRIAWEDDWRPALIDWWARRIGESGR